MTINLLHRGIELTPAIHQYVEEKMSSLQKYYEAIHHIDVEVGLITHHHRKGNIFECKVILQMNGVNGDIIRMEKEADDLYKAIDKVRDHLRVELTEWKRRLQENP